MGKTKYDVNVNRSAKKLNKHLREDVFGDRFYVRQYRKSRTPGEYGWYYYQYELCDREQPERNKIIYNWLSYGDITICNNLWSYMNDFIIASDFWEVYFKKHPKE